MHHAHDPVLVFFSVAIAILASYASLDLATSVVAVRGWARRAWIAGGALAQGVGIWSMHFVAMLAFSIEGVPIAYDVPLLVASVLIAIAGATFTFVVVAQDRVSLGGYVAASLAIGAGISGMHYVAIASMRMAARYKWRYLLVAASLLIAVATPALALPLTVRFRGDLSRRGFLHRALAGVVLGLAVCGMHYTAMAAMVFLPGHTGGRPGTVLMATSGVAVAVIGSIHIILALALAGSTVQRALHGRGAAAREEFIAVVAHDLKSPLSSITTSAGALQRFLAERGDTDREQRAVHHIVHSAMRLATMVEDLMDASRVETERLTLDKKRVDLPKLIEEVVERTAEITHGHPVRVNVGEDVPALEADPSRLEQVLGNLLSNAAKYSFADTEIRVEVERYGHEVLIRVINLGPGLERKDLERIFSRFHRTESALRGDTRGLGLGLYITRGLVVAHRGRIWVESKPGEITTFFISLPAIRKDKKASGASTSNT